MNQAKEALPHCDRAVALKPQDPEFRDSRGFAYLRLGRVNEAVAEYNETLSRNPKHALAMFGRCLALQQLKQAREAEVDCADARALDATVEAFFARHGFKSR
jgi:Flp pilus assembly protein TadD